MTDGEQRIVGHAGEDMGTTSEIGEWRQVAVVRKQCRVCCGDGVAIRKSNGVAGGDGTLVYTRGLWANNMFRAAGVGNSIGGRGGN